MIYKTDSNIYDIHSLSGNVVASWRRGYCFWMTGPVFDGCRCVINGALASASVFMEPIGTYYTIIKRTLFSSHPNVSAAKEKS